MAVLARKTNMFQEEYVQCIYIHEGDFVHPNLVFRGAEDSLDEFRRANLKEGDRGRWKNPPIGMIKVSRDVALNKSKRCIGIGTMVRDSK